MKTASNPLAYSGELGPWGVIFKTRRNLIFFKFKSTNITNISENIKKYHPELFRVKLSSFDVY